MMMERQKSWNETLANTLTRFDCVQKTQDELKTFACFVCVNNLLLLTLYFILSAMHACIENLLISIRPSFEYGNEFEEGQNEIVVTDFFCMFANKIGL